MAKGQKIWSQVVAKAWQDDSFKQRLLSDPATVLAESGLTVPDGIEIKVLENTDTTRHFIMPTPNRELSADQLDHVAGGGSNSCMCICD